MDVSFSLEEVVNEPGKYDWKIELGEVNLTRYNLTFQMKYHDFMKKLKNIQYCFLIVGDMKEMAY